MTLTQTKYITLNGVRVFYGDVTPDPNLSRLQDLWVCTTSGTPGTQSVVKTYDGSSWAAGSITVADGAITNAKVNASAAIDFSKLAASTDINTSGEVTDLTITGETSGDILQFDGSNWTSKALNELGGITVSGLENEVAIDTGTYGVNLVTTEQTVGTSDLTIPDLANVDDTVALVTLAQTLANKTLTSPHMGTSVVLNNATRNLTLKWSEPAGSARDITFTDPGANVNVLYDTPGAAQTVTNKTFTDTTCKFGANGALTKAAKFDLSGATADKTLTLASAHTDDRTVTLPNATDTLVGKATTDTLTNKTFNCDGSGNALQNVNADELDPIAATTGTYGIDSTIVAVNAGAATNVIFNSNAPFKFRVIWAHAVATKACNGNWKLDDGTNDITVNVAYGVDQNVSVVTRIDDARHTISANGSLRLISSDATDTAIVYIKILRVD